MSSRMTVSEWRAYLRSYEWACPKCGHACRGLSELERGRLTGLCPDCTQLTLLFIWGGSGWIDAVVNSIILESD